VLSGKQCAQAIAGSPLAAADAGSKVAVAA
jgi:hypothetical protein